MGRARGRRIHITDTRLICLSGFAAGKLGSRGSQTAHSILTNVQDFIVTLSRGLQKGAADGCPGSFRNLEHQ